MTPDPYAALPEELLDEVFAALFRSRDRQSAIAALIGRHPRYAERIRALASQEPRIGDTLAWDSAPMPERIGAYHLLEPLGEGGMGTVYKAEQREPVRRLVALKVIKLGMDSQEVLARFELERRALAAMSHGSIAKVHDAGTTERGQPFFVMELVEGLPLTDYCDNHRLSLEERIALFQQVCAGVQHAHQKGVIHRDLKPANILVAREDDRAVAKIVDFGLAKATDRDLLAQSIHSVREQTLGTPEYMAPEQAAFDHEAIDARADIYALGVVLYELLTGELPFSSHELRHVSPLERERKLREDEPPKPSARLSTVGLAADECAVKRRTSVRALGRQLRGDLDWIVLKAMAKEPERRYDSAAGLAADLQRYLDHDPVTAGPPSASYRLRKFARRYRLAISAAAVVLLALVVSATVAVLAWKSEAEQRRAKSREALAARSVLEFLTGTLALIDPRVGLKAQPTVTDLLANAEEGVRTDRSLSAQQVAAIADTIGASRLEMGEVRAASAFVQDVLPRVEEQLGSGDLLALRLRLRLAEILQEGERFVEAAVVARDALTRLDGREPSLRVRAASVLVHALAGLDQGEEAERVAQEAREAARLLADRDPVAIEWQRAETSVAMATEHFERARELARRVFDTCRETHGVEHPRTAQALGVLVVNLAEAGENNAAKELLETTIAAAHRALGPDHQRALALRALQANLLRRLDLLGDAGPIFEDTLRRYEHLPGGSDSPAALAVRHGFALYHKDLALDSREPTEQGRRYDRAEAMMQDVLQRRLAVLGPEHDDTLSSESMLALIDYQRGGASKNPEERERFWKRSAQRYASLLEKRRRAGDENLLGYNQTFTNYTGMVYRLGDHQRAKEMFREAIARYERMGLSGHWSCLWALQDLGTCLQQREEFEEAERVMRRAYDGFVVLYERSAPAHLRIVQAAESLQGLYRAWGRDEEAARWKQEIARRKASEDR